MNGIVNDVHTMYPPVDSCPMQRASAAQRNSAKTLLSMFQTLAPRFWHRDCIIAPRLHSLASNRSWLPTTRTSMC